jgi:hypothetical protein
MKRLCPNVRDYPGISWKGRHKPQDLRIIYTTNRKVAGPIRDEVIGFFSSPNLLAALWPCRSTHLTEMSTRKPPGGKGRPARKAVLTAICASII